MKKFIKRFAGKSWALINNQRGESLLEGLASVLVFTALMVTIAMMLMVSMRITHNATQAAEEWQDEANAAIEAAGTPPETGSIEFEVNGQTITIPVGIYTNGDFVSFRPN